MSAGPTFDAKERVREAIDIVDLVGGYLSLRRQGRGYVGICPWHDDSRPSLQVNPERQIWRCWVCDIGGDVFSWMMKREGVDFREALALLADRAGIELGPKREQPAVQPGSPNDKRTLYRAVEWAEKQFQDCLLKATDAEAARQYLEQRGFAAETIERFHIGYSPASWQWLTDRARTTPYSPQVLEAVGLVARSEQSGKYYDRFRGRVIFSIRDTQNRPIAFGGRILPEIAEEEERTRGRTPAKYINSPETRLFSKSDQLYALDVVRDAVVKSRHVVVVEGYTDAVMAWQAGMENVTAVLGTALGERHIRMLRRFADTVTLVLDGDEAGQRRTNEILELFVAADVDLRILTLPEGLDPCDFLLKQGADPFRQLIAGAIDALEHKITVETRGIDVATDTHRANHALENILGTVAKAPRMQSATAASSRLREQQIVARLARDFRVPENELRVRLSELRRTSKRGTSATTASERPSNETIESRESELIEILIMHPELATEAVEEIAAEQLASPDVRQIFDVFQRLLWEGESPSFTNVLTEVDDAGLKSLLVRLESQATEKSAHAQEPAQTRLHGLIAGFRQRQNESERRAKLAALETTTSNEQEQLDIFKQLIQQERNRQGISAPTDG